MRGPQPPPRGPRRVTLPEGWKRTATRPKPGKSARMSVALALPRAM